MPEIQKVSIRHEAIMDYLMSYPKVKLGTVAEAFGVTQPWLSCVIHSDAFQEMLRTKQGIAFHDTVLPIREKMLNVAHQALDRLADQIPFEMESKNLSSIAGDVLERLGYTSKAPAVQINKQTNVTVLAGEIREAQALLGAVAPQRALEGISHEIGGAEALQGEGIPFVGSEVADRTLSLIQGELGKTEARDSVRKEGALEAGGEV